MSDKELRERASEQTILLYGRVRKACEFLAQSDEGALALNAVMEEVRSSIYRATVDAIERYAKKVDDPARAHLHYADCPYKPYAELPRWEEPENAPWPECTCAQQHLGAYWKGQHLLERGYHQLTQKAMLAYRARAYQYAYPSVVELDKQHEAVLDRANDMNSGS